MFNLEKSIAEWRAQLLAAGVKNPLPLEELENHLREDINHLIASGQTEATAFQIAVARVGNPTSVGSEFKKTSPGLSMPFVIGSLVWAALTVAFMAAMAGRWAEGKLNLLLAAHISSLTMGYVTAFLAGGFGIYGVCRPWRSAASTDDLQALNRAIYLFTLVSAVLVVVGFVLGMIWSSQNRGSFWTSGPREIGPLCAGVWLAAVTLAQWLGQINSRNVIRCSIAGNMIVALAWFGAWALAHGTSPLAFWPLDALLAVHLFFLGMSVTPGPEPVEA
jgi:hypothetical protein